MKDWVRLIISVSLLAPVFLISAPSLFAHKFPGRYKPAQNTARSVGTAATTRIPYVVNPRLTLPQQQRVAAFSGAVVDRNVSNRVIEAARQVTNHTPASSVSVNVRPVTTPLSTGLQALQTWRPGWRSELQLTGFTEAQLNAVAQTFIDTDEFLFELDEDGNWLSPAEGFSEWEYRNRFSQILTSGTIPFTEANLKILFGKFSRLDEVFTHLEEQAFVLVYKRAPKPSAPGAEGKLARHVRYNTNKMHPSMNPEVEEYVYGKMPAQLKKTAPSYGPRGRTPNRTPDEILEQVLQFIREHNRFLSRSSEDETERLLRQAFDNACKKAEAQNLKDGTSQRLLALKEQWVREIAEAKTPQEIYDYVTQFMREHNGKLPSTYSKDPVEKSYAQALYTFHRTRKNLREEELDGMDEASRALEKLCRETMRENAKAKTPQEMYDYVTQYMSEHNGKFPSTYSKEPVEKSYAKALYTFHSTRKNLREEELDELDETSRDLEKLCREKIKEYKTPQEIYDYVTQFMREHNGKRPSRTSTDPVEKSHGVALYYFHSHHKNLSDEELDELDPISRALEKLYREKIKGKTDFPAEVVGAE